jgi:hypothetical protein
MTEFITSNVKEGDENEGERVNVTKDFKKEEMDGIEVSWK